MMYYKFNTVRTIETKEGHKNIKITLFSTCEPDKVKEVLRENEILVMSSEKVEQPLGILYEFGIKSKDGDIVPIILATEGKIRDAFKKFINEFEIVDKLEYVKPVGQDLSEDKLKLILNKLKEEAGLINKGTDILDKKTKKLSEKEKKELKRTYEDLKETVESFIKEMEEIIPYTVHQFSVKTKKLQDLIGQLKKYRISTNIYKLSEVFAQALEVGADLEEKYLNFLELQDKDNFSIYLISQFEILKELKKYKKIKNAQILVKVNAKEFKLPWYETILYQSLGKLAPYVLLLSEEQKRKLKIKGLSYVDVMDFFVYMFLFVLLNYSLLVLLNKLNVIEIDLVSVFFSFLMVSYFGFLFALAKLIGYKNKFLGIILILLGILLRKPIKLYFGF